MTGHPGYLNHAVRDYMPTRELRSSDPRLLAQTRTRTTTARRAFNYAASTVWNALPYNVRTADTIGQFRTSLRTHLYPLSFSEWSRDCPLPRFAVRTSTYGALSNALIIIIIIIINERRIWVLNGEWIGAASAQRNMSTLYTRRETSSTCQSR